MTKKGTIQNCLVCGDVSNTIRFGAISCRACGEFFRRKVLSKTEISKQRCTGKCQLNKSIRKTCQNCRFQKCGDSGMMEILVESRVKSNSEKLEKSKPILADLEEGYRKLKECRVQVFGEQKEPKFCTYEEFSQVLEMDMKLILKCIISIFQSKILIGKDQEHILTDNFMMPFVQLENTFRSIGSPSYFLANGNIFNPSHLDQLYKDNHKNEDSVWLDTLKIVQPYWNSTTRNLKFPMDHVKPDLSEILLLSALIYWDFGIQEQSEDCIQKCLQMRKLVLQELTDYEKMKNGEDYCQLRIMEVMGILQGVHKASGVVKDCGHVAKSLNLKGKECPLYEIMDN